ncbi:MAG: glycoside hydrolase family 3 protein [Desulfovibrio sp.]|nr:glycoside hydrolase family 3 protein [Desulfovibrio sp.]
MINGRFCMTCPVFSGLLFCFLLFGLSTAEAGGNEDELKRMVGSMIMCGFREPHIDPSSSIYRQLASGEVGHVILFDRDTMLNAPRNIRDPEQLARLTAELRRASGRPLLIAVDQEGGKVARLKAERGFLPLPSARDMGRAGSSEAFALAKRAGREMRTLGLNCDFAPVADVKCGEGSVIGRQNRSFGRDEDHVARMALSFGQGLFSSHVLPCLKHFPGLGCASVDSHFLTTDITACFSEKRDLAPYVHAFSKGWPGMVMVGHVLTPWDPERPASLSPSVINGVLRGKLGWNGVVISDDLQMKAVSEHYSLSEIVLSAVNAGNDILLFGNNLIWQPDLGTRVFSILMGLVEEGKISRDRIECSFRRIQTLLGSLPEYRRRNVVF